MFLQEASVCNFAKSLLQVILERETISLLEWFRINSIADNPKKFQLMLLGKIDDSIVNIDNIVLKPKSCVKLIGINIDHKLNFSDHVKTLCKSASGKIKALFRIRHYLDLHSAKKVCEAFFMSTFNYCPLIWMYDCKGNDVLLNKVHCRALRAVHQDFSSSFKQLLLSLIHI